MQYNHFKKILNKSILIILIQLVHKVTDILSESCLMDEVSHPSPVSGVRLQKETFYITGWEQSGWDSVALNIQYIKTSTDEVIHISIS